jgi:hypothetical protein
MSRSTAVSAADGLITPRSELEIFDCLGKIWKLHVFYLLRDVHVLNRRHGPGGCGRNASLRSDKEYRTDSYKYEDKMASASINVTRLEIQIQEAIYKKQI